MQISTTARHFDLNPEDRLFAEQRLSRLARYVRDAREAHVVITAEKYRHTAEITLKLKHRDMVSREQSNGARTAIDLAAGRLEEQLRRLKEKRVDRKQRSGNGRVDGFSSPPGEEDLDAGTAEE